MVTATEWQEWEAQPETQLLKEWLQFKVKAMQNDWAGGVYLNKTPADQGKAVGIVDSLVRVIDLTLEEIKEDLNDK